MLALGAETVTGILGATEAAALAASRLVGSGDKLAVDGAAVAAMRRVFDGIDIDATVVVGEGEKDAAPMLFAGERLGTGNGPRLDIAVDPVDGTRLAAAGSPGAIAVLACAPSGTLFDPGPLYYLEKMVAAVPDAGLRLGDPMESTARRLAHALDRPVESLVVAVQDRRRNRSYADDARSAGAQVLHFRDGDVLQALEAARADGGVDLLVGIGGAPEAVLTAAAVRSMGGWMQCRPAPQRADERAGAVAAGLHTSRVITLDELAADDGYLFVTAVTDVPPLRGAGGEPAVTESWVLAPGGRWEHRAGPALPHATVK